MCKSDAPRLPSSAFIYRQALGGYRGTQWATLFENLNYFNDLEVARGYWAIMGVCLPFATMPSSRLAGARSEVDAGVLTGRENFKTERRAGCRRRC